MTGRARGAGRSPSASQPLPCSTADRSSRGTGTPWLDSLASKRPSRYPSARRRRRSDRQARRRSVPDLRPALPDARRRSSPTMSSLPAGDGRRAGTSARNGGSCRAFDPDARDQSRFPAGARATRPLQGKPGGMAVSRPRTRPQDRGSDADVVHCTAVQFLVPWAVNRLRFRPRTLVLETSAKSALLFSPGFPRACLRS